MSALPSNPDPCLESAAASDASIQRVHAELQHQKPEPEPGGYDFTPLLLLGFMSGMILFVCIFFVHNRGGFDSLVYNGHLDPNAPKPAVPDTIEVRIAKGKSLYGQSCVQCHGPAGLGVPGKYPPLAGSDWANGSEERIVRILLHGLKDLIHVNGQPVPTPEKMPSLIAPPFGYSDTKIANVLTYVRQDFTNKAAPIEAETVAAIREKIAAHKGEFIEAELLAIPAQ